MSGPRKPPTLDRDGVPVLDLENYVPYYLAAINNALTRGASQRYLRDYDIGISQWRVVSMLAIEPGIPAARIVEVVTLDKSATSRALHDLSDKGLARADDAPRPRWWLTETGEALHARILEVALARERQLVEGITAEDLRTTIRALSRMRRNVSDLSGD